MASHWEFRLKSDHLPWSQALPLYSPWSLLLLSLPNPTPVTLVSLLFLQWIRQAPIPGPLAICVPCPRNGLPHTWHSLTSFKSLFKCHLLREAFRDYLLKSCSYIFTAPIFFSVIYNLVYLLIYYIIDYLFWFWSISLHWNRRCMGQGWWPLVNCCVQWLEQA